MPHNQPDTYSEFGVHRSTGIELQAEQRSTYYRYLDVCMCAIKFAWVRGGVGAWARGRVGAWARGCVGAWVRGRVGAWVRGCVRLQYW